ncbi:MAG: hypothetical protein ABFS05_08120 [Bacteroidota bacterium]
MKKTLLTIIITLVVAAGLLFASHVIWGEGHCIFDDDDKAECTPKEKKECCDKKHDADAHAEILAYLQPLRLEFDTILNDEEKDLIAGIKEKIGNEDYTKDCQEGHKKFREEHKADFEALTAIAENHKEYFDDLLAKLKEHHKEGCKHDDEEEGEDNDESEGEEDDDDKEGEVSRHHKCPEVHKCKDAKEKCKGVPSEEAKKKCTEEELKKCKEAEAKCDQECEHNFRVHFLLLDFE